MRTHAVSAIVQLDVTNVGSNATGVTSGLMLNVVEYLRLTSKEACWCSQQNICFKSYIYICDRVRGNWSFVGEINYAVRALKVFLSYTSKFAFFTSHNALTILDHSHLF